MKPSRGPQLNPQGTDPLATGTKGTTSTQAVGSLDSKGLDALFNKASKSYENILSSLGHNLQPIEDPTARLLDRSNYLGNLLTADPSLKDRVKQSDLAQVSAFSRLFLELSPSLEGDRKVAVDSYLRTASMLLAVWPPPPDLK